MISLHEFVSFRDVAAGLVTTRLPPGRTDSVATLTATDDNLLQPMSYQAQDADLGQWLSSLCPLSLP